MENNTTKGTCDPQGAGSVDRSVRRVLVWVAMNGAMAWCAWAGVHGNEGAGRVYVFVTWLFAIIATLGFLIGDKKIAEKLQKEGRPVWPWLSHGYDATMIVFLVWHGWWWTAIGVTLLTIAEANIYAKPNVPGQVSRTGGTRGCSASEVPQGSD